MCLHSSCIIARLHFHSGPLGLRVSVDTSLMQDRHIVTPEAKLVSFLLLAVSLSQIRNTAWCQKKSNNEAIFVFLTVI